MMDGKGKDIVYKTEEEELMVVREVGGVHYEAIPQQVAPIYAEMADELTFAKLYTEDQLKAEIEKRTVKLREEVRRFELESLLYKAEVDWLRAGKVYTEKEIKATLEEKYEIRSRVEDVSYALNFYTEAEFEAALTKQVQALIRQKQLHELGASLFKGRAQFLKDGISYTTEQLEAKLDEKYDK